VVGGAAATMDEWRRTRPTSALADVLAQKNFREGRVASIRKIEPATTLPPPQISYYLAKEHWKLPKNYAELAAGSEIRRRQS